ncbi:MAG: hypothetical protein C4343_00095 [Chloroflexota bacterium]
MIGTARTRSGSSDRVDAHGQRFLAPWLSISLLAGLVGILAAAPASAATTIVSTSATSTPTTVTFTVEYTGSDRFFRVYIDTDQNAATGFAVAGIGANYLVEGGAIYPFMGTSQSQWCWGTTSCTGGGTAVTYANDGSVATWTVARSSIGETTTPNAMDVVVQTETPGTSTTTSEPSSFVIYGASTALIANPERGFYRFEQSRTCHDNDFTLSQLQGYRQNGYTLVMCTFTLSTRSGDLTATELAHFDNQMAVVRAAHLKAIVRFEYTRDASSASINDADLVFEVQKSGHSPPITSNRYYHDYVTQPPAGHGTIIDNYRASFTQSTVTYEFDYSNGPYAQYRVYIDADQSAATGFAVGGIGADYLLEGYGQTTNNASLYQFTGTQGTNQWSWGTTVLTGVTYTNSGSHASFTIPRADISETQIADNLTGHDAPKAIVLRHLDQLAPYLARNRDVILLMPAGFIGTWGEWFYSQFYGNAGTITPRQWADRAEIVAKMLSVLPADRMIQLRAPRYKYEIFRTTPLTAGEAYNGTNVPRTGHFNDCFLASNTDFGTYSYPPDTDKDYLAAETLYVPMGGETCHNTTADTPPSNRSRCYTTDGGAAIAELSRFHWSYLNWDYNRAVLDGWARDGCLDEVKQKLGYRFVLVDGVFPRSASKARGLTISFRVRNDGWAAPFNRRGVEVVLRSSSGATYRLPLPTTVDPRKWYPGTTTTVSATLSLSSVPTDHYSLWLNLPDFEPNLAIVPDYSIQLANTGTWDAATGYNRLNASVTVTP